MNLVITPGFTHFIFCQTENNEIKILCEVIAYKLLHDLTTDYLSNACLDIYQLNLGP